MKKKSDRERLFEVMSRLDKTFKPKLNEEETLLLENVQQAEKILKLNNIDPNDSSFIDFKNQLIKDNHIGFLGLITKLSITKKDHQNSLEFHIGRAQRIYDEIMKNKNLLKFLPKPLQQYKNGSDLYHDLQKLPSKQILKKISNKLTNKELAKQLNNHSATDEEIEDVKYLLGIKSEDRKEFLTKTDKYETTEDFFKNLAIFVEDHKFGFNYPTVLNKIKNMSDDEIRVVYNDDKNEMILAIIKEYSAAQELGSKSWCIVDSMETFNQYTENGKNFQYFFFNFKPNTPANEKMIAFTMNPEGQITASHDRYDGEFSNPQKYLQNLGVLRKFIEINSRERAENKMSNIGDDKSKYDYGQEPKKIITYNQEGKVIDERHELISLIQDFAEAILDRDINGKYHLDLLIKKFQNYPIIIIKIFKNHYPYKEPEYSKENINAIPYVISDLENRLKKNNSTIWIPQRDEHGNPIEVDLIKLKERLINVFMKIYQAQIPLKNDTKVAILHFLKDNKTDVLQFVKQTKAKKGQDLSPSEFGVLAKKGEDLRPIIQNKLAALRKGENVNITRPEIKYAIENGYRDVVTKYFKDALPYYYENQLDYDNMETYKQLGMMPDVEQVITTKGDMYGVDTLNSIEKSIYDMSKRKIST